MTPEQNLWVAVVATAIQEALKTPTPYNSQRCRKETHRLSSHT